MNEATMTKMTVTMLAALAHETRLALFRLLIRRGPEGSKAGDIARELAVPNSTLSYHLTELEQARLITSTKQQRQIIYAANMEALEDFLAFLIEDCCQTSGDPCFSLLNKRKDGCGT